MVVVSNHSQYILPSCRHLFLNVVAVTRGSPVSIHSQCPTILIHCKCPTPHHTNKCSFYYLTPTTEKEEGWKFKWCWWRCSTQVLLKLPLLLHWRTLEGYLSIWGFYDLFRRFWPSKKSQIFCFVLFCFVFFLGELTNACIWSLQLLL